MRERADTRTPIPSQVYSTAIDEKRPWSVCDGLVTNCQELQPESRSTCFAPGLWRLPRFCFRPEGWLAALVRVSACCVDLKVSYDELLP